ncbi:hypothetical protein [Fibrobacter sp. UWB13]|uniref:hypothetical protein n=1 Tax=Fibrobacter sp. UWB13 TaxID=1896204 RepID=UPI000A0BB89F|nr:hypothetical protein [Fibrobacter sp. UWB13]SMG41153.1 hypothetical protein SAMN05720489_2865 [Fibrobacter sp. UWB13]
MNMKMKRLLIALLSASVAASASAVADNQKALQAKADSANAKRGVEIGGSIRAVAQRSSFSTDNDPTGINNMTDVERNEFVSADLNFGFRPYEFVRANVTMRLGGGMQEYFAAASKTLEAKWLNVEGNIGKNFYWVVGDFRQEITPLTIYNPGIDIMYEPTIFARKRHMAQKEQLLEGNKRNLQGVNLQFRQEIDPMIGELRAEAFFARVNRVSVLDFTGAEGNILPGDEVDGTSLASATDKWLVGGNIELLPMQKNIFVGVTPMLIFDNESTNSYTYRHVNRDPVGFVPGDKANPYEMQQINPYDDALQNTFVLSARVGADVAALMQNKNLTLDLVAEYAMSMNKTKTLSKVVQGPAAIDPTTGEELTDPETGETVYTQLTLPTTEESANGSAILANLNVGYKVDNSWSAGLALDFIRNDEKWFNNLAQSPSFFAQRILNSDKDGETVKYGVNSPLYSTFDALYNYSPKFSPMTRSLGTNDDKIRDGQSKSYNIAPYNKNSWGSNVYTAEQLALLNLMMDPALQLALPNGLATANRMGVRALIKGDWQGMVEAQALVSIFNQVKPEIEGLDKVSYMEFGGGAKVDIAKIAGLSKALEVSGSYKHSESKNNMMYGGVVGTLKSDFINAGLCAQFLPRLGFTAGFQMINSDYGVGNVETKVGADIPLMKSKQMQWMVGFDYTVADNAWLAINYGMINVTNDYNTATVTGTPRNLPDYFSNTKKGKADGVTGTYQHKFSQSIFEASINVEF